MKNMLAAAAARIAVRPEGVCRCSQSISMTQALEGDRQFFNRIEYSHSIPRQYSSSLHLNLILASRSSNDPTGLGIGRPFLLRHGHRVPEIARATNGQSNSFWPEFLWARTGETLVAQPD
jgi:hypothetical protein